LSVTGLLNAFANLSHTN